MSPKSWQLVITISIILWYAEPIEAIPLAIPSVTIGQSLLQLQAMVRGLPIEAPIKGPDVNVGDGDVVAKQVYIYKCKVCDMPRIFKMNYASSVF